MWVTTRPRIEACPATPPLAPGDSITCTATDTIGQADLDAGSLTNTATATNGTVTSNSDSETVDAVQDPELTLVKTASPAIYSTVGDVIDYGYTLTNTGNVTLNGPFTVTDDQVSVSCPAGDLVPGANLVCTASDTVTQADIDAGSITNVATATNGSVTSNSDTRTVIAAQGPDLELVKTGTPGTYNTVGDVITYDYLVTNIGNVTLDGPVTVADDKVTVSCPAVATLAPNDFVHCSSTYTISQADLDAGSVTNTASATADGTTSPDDTETVTAAQGPALTLAKNATPSTYAAVGASIAYSYTVTNSGNVSLAGPFTVTDDKTTVTCPATLTLSVGADITCTATYTITQADIDAGSVTNVASASNGTVTSNTATETVTAAQGPALTLAKNATPSTYAAVGATIAYTYTVTNAGNVSLAGPFTVTDDKTTVTCPPTPSLAVGAHITCTATYTITQADIDAGSVTNIASASNGTVTSNTATETVTAAQGPALTLTKTPTPTTYAAVGDVIDYSYVVTNSGNVTLDGPVTVADDKVTVTCPAVATLDPGDQVTCTASATITQADIDAGSVVNTASASADGVTSPDASATATAAQGPDLEVVKTATPSTYDSVGDVISYTYVVTNTGNVTLSGPFTVSDDQTTVTCPATPSLPIGADITCTATSTITQADLDAGSLTNTASASNGSVTSEPVTETVTATQGPALTLAKTGTPGTYDSVGDVIAYSYVVTNTGNVSLDGPVTVDR